MAQNSFQKFPRRRFWWVIITSLYQLMLQSWYQNCPIIAEHVGIVFTTRRATIATLWPAKNTLDFSFKHFYFKNGTVNFFSSRNLISRIKCNFSQSFKKILYMGFRATLNFRQLKVALNSMYRTFLNFGKSCILSCLLKFYNKKKFSCRFWNISA